MWKNMVQARQATGDNIMLRGNDAIFTPDNLGKNTNTRSLY
jgi:hypothetical protein